MVRTEAWTLESERRHTVEVKAWPPRAAVLMVQHLRAVHLLVCALRRLVGEVITYLLILLFLFDAERLRRRLGGAAVTLVSGAVGQSSVHLLLEDVRQGV